MSVIALALDGGAMHSISFPVFVCHTSDLNAWVDQLRRYSDRLNTRFRCEFWTDDHEITATEPWQTRAMPAIARAHGAVLLLGERFMTSQAIQEQEWPRINERRRRGFPVVCVPIEGCDKEELRKLLNLEKIDDQMAVPPWNSPLPATPESLSKNKPELDRTIAGIYSKIEQAIGAKSRDLQKHLRNNFTLERCLGIGPISSTYAAHDHHLDRKVVIKCLTKVENANLFADSIKRVGKISPHPNIVSTHSASLDRDPYYSIKEFIEGRSLRARLDDTPDEGLPFDLTQKILISMCSAIGHFHALGKSGLNIKPSNIIIGNNDEPKFCPSCGDEEVLGSKDGWDYLGNDIVYVPPERRSRVQKPDMLKADQYRLGVLGYEMLLGRNRFASQAAYRMRLSTLDPPLESSDARVRWCAVETLLPGCPKFLSDTINQMIAIKPEDRLQSMMQARDKFAQRNFMVEIARESYKRIVKGDKGAQIEFFELFYDSLVNEYCKDSKIYFEQAFGPLDGDARDGWNEQFSKLKHAVLLLLAYASLNEDEEPTILTEYAVSHRERGIPRRFYKQFGECLIEAAVRADLSDRRSGLSDDELRDAWRGAIKDGIGYMERLAGEGP